MSEPSELYDAILTGNAKKAEEVTKAAYPLIHVTAIAKGEAVTIGKPDNGGHAGNGEALHQYRQDVLCAHQACVEQGKARQCHKQDQCCRGQYPGGISTVQLVSLCYRWQQSGEQY